MRKGQDAGRVGSREVTLLTANGTLLTDPRRRRLAQTNDRGHVIGQDHPGAKLKDHDVDLIRELLAEGMTCREAAEKFEVSIETVRSISCGRRRGQLATGQRLLLVTD